MSARSFNATSSRYGFNGKENDNETVGTGEGTQDYGMRIYNPAIGRFLSVDPLASNYPFLTPYQFANNNPIWATDLDGLETNFPTTENGYDLKIKSLDAKAINEKMKNLEANINKIYQTVKLDDKIKTPNENYIKSEIFKRTEWDDNGNPIVEPEEPISSDSKSTTGEIAGAGAKEVLKKKVTDKVQDKLENKFVSKANSIRKVFKIIDVVEMVLDPVEMGDQLPGWKIEQQMQKNKINNAIDVAVDNATKPKKDLTKPLKLEVKVQKTDALKVKQR